MHISRHADVAEMGLPFDIVLQTVLSLLLTMFGVLHIAGDFKVDIGYRYPIELLNRRPLPHPELEYMSCNVTLDRSAANPTTPILYNIDIDGCFFQKRIHSYLSTFRLIIFCVNVCPFIKTLFSGFLISFSSVLAPGRE